MKLGILPVLLITLSFVYGSILISNDTYSISSGLNNQRTIVRDSFGNLYIAYSRYDGANYQIYIAFSSDGGATWNPSWATITSGTSTNIQVSMAIDSHDTLHLVWMGNMTSAGSNDADLMYRKYPGGTNTVLCTYTGYPGAHCPSIAVGPDDDVHIAYTGCPSSWRVRYLHYNRTTDTWDPPEDIGVMTPSRFPSIEVDSLNQPHILYRNTYGSNYRIAHRVKVGGVWRGYNGEDRDTVDIFTTTYSKTEHTSLFIDDNENLHAVWDWNTNFGVNPDTVRYRKYTSASSSWGPELWLFGNDATDAHITYSGDVIVDTLGKIYVFYHDNDSVFITTSTDGGSTFPVDSALTHASQCRFPNARGSKYPSFNRVYDECIDYVYAFKHPDSAFAALYYDNLCGFLEETTAVCANFLEPAESSITSCSDQQIVINIGCCPGGDSTFVMSSPSVVEFYDSTMDIWEPAIASPDSLIWSSFDHLPGATWVWTDDHPPPTYHDDWFRVFINTSCDHYDSAFIRIQCDNKAYIYINNDSCFTYLDSWIDTTHGNSGPGYDGWRTLYEFNLTPYFHGGTDTIYIRGHNASGQAGMQFELVAYCSPLCCGEIDTSSIQMTVNGSTYTISNPELSWDGESLLTFTPIPPDTFRDGDTVIACLINVEDTCTGTLDSTICRTFFVDIAPPIIQGISPPPDTIISDTLPDVQFCLFDSISGLDTASIGVTINDSTYEVSPFWNGSCWEIDITSLPAFGRGDTVNICVTASDTTDYCADNLLDTCWSFYVRPCIDALAWLICPSDTCGFWTSCTTQAIIVGIWDSTGAEIDTTRIFFTAIVNHSSGTTDTIAPVYTTTLLGDTVVVNAWSFWTTGDTVLIMLDSLFTTDGCKTVP